MLKEFLSRIYEQARALWRVARGPVRGRADEAIDLFLNGQSIQKISALLMPGIGGPPLVARQMEIQAALREYCLAQEKRILEQQDTIAELRAQLAEAMEQAIRAASTPAPAAGQPMQPADAPDLLAGLLGIQAA